MRSGEWEAGKGTSRLQISSFSIWGSRGSPQSFRGSLGEVYCTLCLDPTLKCVWLQATPQQGPVRLMHLRVFLDVALPCTLTVTSMAPKSFKALFLRSFQAKRK